MTPKVAIKTPESLVLGACKQLLDMMHIWNHRMQVGKFSAKYTRKRDNREVSRIVKFGRPGMADLLALPWVKREETVGDGRSTFYFPLILWIETKTTGGKQSDEQIEFEREVKAQGHHYLVIASVDQLVDWMRKNGVK